MGLHFRLRSQNARSLLESCDTYAWECRGEDVRGPTFADLLAFPRPLRYAQRIACRQRAGVW